MRQTGVLAAAGLCALEEILPSLNEDHESARVLAVGLKELGFDVEPPQTNLIYFSLSPGTSHPFTASELVSACAREGVRFLVVPGSDVNRMRMVCHHQMRDGVQRTLDAQQGMQRARLGGHCSVSSRIWKPWSSVLCWRTEIRGERTTPIVRPAVL